MPTISGRLLDMREGQGGWPSRSTVEAVWRAVAEGARSREEAHDWTLPWVEPWVDGSAGDLGPGDAMVNGALQHIHGFSMAYNPETPHLIHDGPPGVWVRTLEMVSADLEKWIHDCRRYDDDPDELRRLAREVAHLIVEAERTKKRRQRRARETKHGPA